MIYQLVFSRPHDNGEWWHLAGLGGDLERAVIELYKNCYKSANKNLNNYGWKYKVVQHKPKNDSYVEYLVDDGEDVPEGLILAVLMGVGSAN